MGLPIGSGMIESACKWLIQQRFKGVGMRWSEDGFNHLLHLRLAWVNYRFDALFSDESLVLTLYSPNRACAPESTSFPIYHLSLFLQHNHLLRFPLTLV